MAFLNKKLDISGFTLIEVMVSMMVMAISLSIIMSLFSGGLRSKKRADDFNIAVDMANYKTEEILLEQTIEPGILEGTFENGYYWKMEIVADDPENSESTIEIQPVLKAYRINTEIRWKHNEQEKTYTLQTLHLEDKKEPGRIHTS